MQVSIRPIEAGDKVKWRELWHGYCRFYEYEPAAELTKHLWQRILDPHASVHAIVAVDTKQHIVGFANYLIHEDTSAMTPICYLHDLFVDPVIRKAGVGRALIDWLVSEMKAKQWAKLYWHTKENNYPARVLYDSYTTESGFLTYIIKNDA